MMEGRNWNVIRKLKNPKESESDFAILILNQSICCDPEVVISLWKNAAFRILVDGGSNKWIEFLEALQIKDLKLPDFISGDFDSITPETREYFESRKVEIIFTPNQDETDFTKALRCASKVFQTKYLNTNTPRIIANICTLHRSSKILEGMPVVILSSQSVTWVLEPGKHSIFVPEEFIEKQYPCGLIPLCGPTLVTTSGLKWNLENNTLEIDGLVSTSNTYVAIEVNVTCDRHLVWTTQYCKMNQ